MTKDFYSDIVGGAGIRKDASILVVCAGPYDRQVFLNHGFKDVTISNLEHHDRVVSDYAPYNWQRQDAENLTLADNSFDWAVVHAGLHHCGSPHRALCEMLRVAREGVLVVEARDSFLMRAAVKLGLTVDFELAPTALTGASNQSHGGYRNSFIPNYIYRWTERDVEKTVASYIPQRQPKIRYFYGLRLPIQRIAMSKNVAARAAVSLLQPLGWLFALLVPRQGNVFAFAIDKRGPLQPWMLETEQALDINKAYFDARFAPDKYKAPQS